MANFNLNLGSNTFEDFNTTEFLNNLGLYVAEVLRQQGINGGLTYSSADALGNVDLNIQVEGSPEECHDKRIGRRKSAAIIVIRDALLEEYQNLTPLQKKSYRGVIYLARLKAFSNNLITLHCPRPLGPIQARIS